MDTYGLFPSDVGEGARGAMGMLEMVTGINAQPLKINSGKEAILELKTLSAFRDYILGYLALCFSLLHSIRNIGFLTFVFLITTCLLQRLYIHHIFYITPIVSVPHPGLLIINHS